MLRRTAAPTEPPRTDIHEGGQPHAFRLDGGPQAARFRVHSGSRTANDGPSDAVVAGFSWSHCRVEGVRQWDLVFYEVHVGTFTLEGTFDAIVPWLGDLCELGISALEIITGRPVSGHSQLGL